MLKFNQSGRSMVEMLAVLAIIGVLSIVGIHGFKEASVSSRAKTISKDVATALTERRYQNAQNGGSKKHILTLKVGSTPMTIQNKEFEGKQQISITLPNLTKDLCEELKKFDFFKPNNILVGTGTQEDNKHYAVANGQEKGPCAQMNAMELFFDQFDEGSGNGGALSSPCDGVKCGKCEKCADGKCVVDKNKVGRTFGCGQCQADGTMKKDPSQENSCTTCDESDWSVIYTKKGNPCNPARPCRECDGNGSCVSKGNECDGKCCASNETCCGTECCSNGCNNAGNGCAKECTPACDKCHTCNTETGECEFKTLGEELCGDTCCKSEKCCNGQCCADGEICDGGECKAPSEDKCSDPNKPYKTASGECVECLRDSHCSGKSNVKFCDKSTHTCVQCTKDKHCGTFYMYDDEKGCRNGTCDYNPCNLGSCQTCHVTSINWNAQTKQWEPKVQHGFKPQGTACVQSGVQGTCDAYGICNPKGTPCNSIQGCPNGQFCNYGGTYDWGASQHGRRGATPNICEPVNPVQFTVTDENGKSTTYYYPSREDLRSWCRAADEGYNCAWGYLAYPGAQSWCYGIGKSLLTSDEFKKIITASDSISQIETLDAFSKKYTDLQELTTFITEIQERIKVLEDNDEAFNSLTKQYNLLDELSTDCDTLSDLNNKLTEIHNLIKGYTTFDQLKKHITTLKQYIKLHRNIAKSSRWGGAAYTKSDALNTSVWVKGGVYSTNGAPYSARPDGYWGAGSVICK